MPLPSPTPEPRVAPPCAPALGVTIDPPDWFHGRPSLWQDERQRFERATRLDLNGAQHVLVGAVVMLLGVLTMLHCLPWPEELAGAPWGWALLASGTLAAFLGNLRRASAHHLMIAAIWLVLKHSANPAVDAPVGMNPEADTDLAVAAHLGRRRSPRGSFDELVNATVEARRIGGVVVAPLRVRGGMVFRTMAPLPVPPGTTGLRQQGPNGDRP